MNVKSTSKEMLMHEKQKNYTGKERVFSHSNFISATFDLQSVLQIPSSDVSPIITVEKLVCII